MKKVVDAKLRKSLAELGDEKHIDFKNKYFPQEFMTAHWSGYWIPSTIYELLTVLPKSVPGETHRCKLLIRWYHKTETWFVGYVYEEIGSHKNDEYKGTTYQPELVDALGKLLIWCIEEGWVG